MNYICDRCGFKFSKQVDKGELIECPRCHGYDTKENAMEDYAKMVKKEKAEHPEFTDKQIDQIVADHLKSKDNCSQFSPDRKTRANAWRDKTNKYNGKCPECGGKTTNHGRRDWCPNCEKAFEAWETK